MYNAQLLAYLSTTPVVGTNNHVCPCTTHNNWRICQLHQSWERIITCVHVQRTITGASVKYTSHGNAAWISTPSTVAAQRQRSSP